MTALPTELLNDILSRALFANKKNGVHFTYGLLENSGLFPEQHSPRLTKYVRSPLRDEVMAMDAAWAIRRVCRQWGDWALSQNFREIHEQCCPSQSRWADLTPCRSKYSLYELIENPQGTILNRDQNGSLRKTYELLHDYPLLSQHVRRLWFGDFHTAATDKWILSIIKSCTNLESLTIPWTALRRGTAEDWINVLKLSKNMGTTLQSLEIRSICLSSEDEPLQRRSEVSKSLKDTRVSFGGLSRLRLSGDAGQSTISDDDLVAISRTALNLSSIHITGSAKISVLGVLALVKSSRKTLGFLEYRPLPNACCQSSFRNRWALEEADRTSQWTSDRHQSTDRESGFSIGNSSFDFNPVMTALQDAFVSTTELLTPRSPTLNVAQHLCHDLSTLPRLREVDISLPSICTDLFAHSKMPWSGTCIIGFSRICQTSKCDKPQDYARLLRRTLESARLLTIERKRLKKHLIIELTNGSYIFRPDQELVYGDFSSESIALEGEENKEDTVVTATTWSKIPGPNGLRHMAISETKFLRAISNGWLEL